MALETDVQELTAAIRELTTVLSTFSSSPPQVAQEQQPKVSKPAAKKESAPAPEQAKDPEPDLLGGDDTDEVTPEQFMKDTLLPAFKKLLAAQGGQAKAKAILTELKAANLGALPKDMDVYRTVLAKTEEALNG